MNSATPATLFVSHPKSEAGNVMSDAQAFTGLRSTDRAVREEILHRAYALWESEGHPEGRDLVHWTQAETDVLESRR